MTTTRIPGVAAEVIAVRPGPPLNGVVTVDGSKNAALPLVAAAAALGCPVRLSNIPANTDVQTMLALLQESGWHVAQSVGKPTAAVILPTENQPVRPPPAPGRAGLPARPSDHGRPTATRVRRCDDGTTCHQHQDPSERSGAAAPYRSVGRAGCPLVSGHKGTSRAHEPGKRR
ncbi:hypothetical protein ACFVOO_03600 [Streptomyces rochei]|uniref:hypothetical protein n=1 Tax=Streptomyces rochei TaxID=1928 RepID=UPI0036B1BB3C